MNFNDIFKNSFLNSWETTQNIQTMTMVLTFVVVCLLSIFILLIYRQTTKASFYSLNFAKTLVGVPIVTTAIVFAMQVNLLVSLGMVGALSIVRFRTAIKDPVDLLFLFWSISVGIVCGTGSYVIAIFLSAIMSVVLFGLDFLPTKIESKLLVINASCDVNDDEIFDLIKQNTSFSKTRTIVSKKDTKDFLIEVKSKSEHELIKIISNIEHINKVAILSHDGEVRL